MNLSGLSLPMSSGSINTGLEFVLLSKTLNLAEDTGQALEKMMESVVTPGLGEHIDIRV